LFVTGQATLGSLHLLATEPNVVTDESEHLDLMFASHAAVELADAQDLQGVISAVINRDVIGQAREILMDLLKSLES
jgi:hypothetical protein